MQARLRHQPRSTPLERALGTYLEGIEPQVLNAVLILRRKGYTTTSSGFYMQGAWQGIDGLFVVPPTAATMLRSLDVWVLQAGRWIGFAPVTASLAAITRRWSTIAARLPHLGQPAQSTPAAGDPQLLACVMANDLAGFTARWAALHQLTA